MSAKEVLALKERTGAVVDGNEAVHFKLVRSPADLRDESSTFKPAMSHQIFGEEEQIYGYENIIVKLYYAAASLTPYLKVCYDSRLPEALPNNIEKTLSEKYEMDDFVTNIDEFEKLLQNESNFVPYGTMLHSFNLEEGANTRTFCIFKSSLDTKGFLKYHAKMQTFLLWFVDAASFIDPEDPYWKFFVLYEKFKSTDNLVQYGFVGYFSVYEFYCYPDKVRPRISQALILPPFQGKGLCAKLMQAMQLHYSGMRNVYDITVEDPSLDFQRVRDYVDCCNCMRLPSCKPEKLKEGFSNEIVEELRSKFKINKKQARRVYEILRLSATNVYKEIEYKEYRLDVKKRLNVPISRQNQILIKTHQEHLIEKKEETIKRLKEMFDELVEEYQKVIDRCIEHPLN